MTARTRSMSYRKIILLDKILQWTRKMYFREEDLDRKEAMQVIAVPQILASEKIVMTKYHFLWKYVIAQFYYKFHVASNHIKIY